MAHVQTVLDLALPDFYTVVVSTKQRYMFMCVSKLKNPLVERRHHRLVFCEITFGCTKNTFINNI